MADVIPNSFKKNIMNGTIDLDSNTLKVMLLDSNHASDADAQEFIDDVNTNEVSGGGYTSGGKTLTNVSVAQDDTNNRAVLDADNVTWASSSITARYAVVYADKGTPETSPIISIIDFGSDKVSSGDNFNITWNSNGIITIS